VRVPRGIWRHLLRYDGLHLRTACLCSGAASTYCKRDSLPSACADCCADMKCNADSCHHHIPSTINIFHHRHIPSSIYSIIITFKKFYHDHIPGAIIRVITFHHHCIPSSIYFIIIVFHHQYIPSSSHHPQLIKASRRLTQAIDMFK
jgi:hypothetical protein